MALLRFFSQYFGFLKFFPFPHALDGMLLLWTYATQPELLDVLDTIDHEVKSWPGVTTVRHKFGGIEYRKGRAEIGHIHSNGVLDIRFSRAERDRMVKGGSALSHHTMPDSGWVSFRITKEADREGALALLKQSFNGVP